jgi:hypothetical protein
VFSRNFLETISVNNREVLWAREEFGKLDRKVAVAITEDDMST